LRGHDDQEPAPIVERNRFVHWVIPLNEPHLRRVLAEWIDHYNRGRPHASLGPGLPEAATNEAPVASHAHRLSASYRVVVNPVLGGLHHEYRLEAAA
jgi:putative transposase